MMASLWLTKNKAMVSINGQTVGNKLAGGLKVSNMATAYILAAKGMRNMGYGSMASYSLGLTLARSNL